MAHHEIQSDLGYGDKSLAVYVGGVIACVFLTLIPFAAVMYPMFFHATAIGIVVASALAQFIIQLVCFLRLNYDTEQARLNVRSFALCLFILFAVVVGSLWIMASLDYRMMH